MNEQLFYPRLVGLVLKYTFHVGLLKIVHYNVCHENYLFFLFYAGAVGWIQMVNHMTDAVSKQQFLAADKTCGCETTTIKYRVENKKGNFNATPDEPFISRLSRDNIFGLLTVMAS